MDVVAGHTATLAPTAFDVGAVAGLADLLGVAIHATEIAINLFATLSVARQFLREGLAFSLVKDRLQLGVA